jgi:hypothetical protein
LEYEYKFRAQSFMSARSGLNIVIL